MGKSRNNAQLCLIAKAEEIDQGAAKRSRKEWGKWALASISGGPGLPTTSQRAG